MTKLLKLLLLVLVQLFFCRQVPNTREGRLLEQGRGKILIVVSSGGENLKEFCRWLVQCDFPYVCSLHGGIQVLISANVL